MKRTTHNINQEPDRISLTFSIPRGLIPIPILSHTEQMIISRIMSLSSKYSTNGGCNLPNSALAYRQECSVSVVSSAISKATWLGMLQHREDNIDKHENKDGSISITQKRRLKLVLPEIWNYFGELWADFYFGGDEGAFKILTWMKEYISNEYKKQQEKQKDTTLDIIKMIEGVYEFSIRGGFENYTTPFLNSKGSLFEKATLLMFTEVNVFGNKSLLNSSLSGEDKITVSLFDKFWNLYPRKGSKGEALTKWKAICNRSIKEKPTWPEIKKAILSQKKSEQWQDPKYIPLAATWLNQRRWLDDPKELVSYSKKEDIPKSKITTGFMSDEEPDYSC